VFTSVRPVSHESLPTDRFGARCVGRRKERRIPPVGGCRPHSVSPGKPG
jgi:hypothetical protein